MQGDVIIMGAPLVRTGICIADSFIVYIDPSTDKGV